MFTPYDHEIHARCHRQELLHQADAERLAHQVSTQGDVGRAAQRRASRPGVDQRFGDTQASPKRTVAAARRLTMSAIIIAIVLAVMALEAPGWHVDDAIGHGPTAATVLSEAT
jgi:hypothetical protein